VVSFDDLRGAFEGDGFDHIRVKSTLQEEFYRPCFWGVCCSFFDFLGFGLEDIDEEAANDSSFLGP
jgi:hypothetical protein